MMRPLLAFASRATKKPFSLSLSKACSFFYRLDIKRNAALRVAQGEREDCGIYGLV
jgi:hypothetical protein